jgi:hypothetical protein
MAAGDATIPATLETGANRAGKHAHHFAQTVQRV